MIELNPMQLIHYGTTAYCVDNVAPIVDDPQRAGMKKPSGGLWTSPVNSKYGWKDWCEAESFGTLQEWVFLDFVGRVLTIDCVNDLDQLDWYTPDYFLGLCKPSQYPLFEPLLPHYDAIHLTEEGHWSTRLPPGPRDFYGWDCETVLILNPQRLEQTGFGSDILQLDAPA